MHRSDLRERLLPAGRLREPLSSLERAGVIVLREEDAELRVHAPRLCGPGLPLLAGAAHACPDSSTGKRALAFCAIARPEEFFRALAAAGVEVVERMSFRDHHRYTAADMDRLAKLARRHGCDEFVTTAKDEVKLDAAMRLQLNAVAPLRTAALTVEIEDEGAVVSQLVSLLRDMRKSPLVTAKRAAPRPDCAAGRDGRHPACPAGSGCSTASPSKVVSGLGG